MRRKSLNVHIRARYFLDFIFKHNIHAYLKVNVTGLHRFPSSEESQIVFINLYDVSSGYYIPVMNSNNMKDDLIEDLNCAFKKNDDVFRKHQHSYQTGMYVVYIEIHRNEMKISNKNYEIRYYE